MHIWAVVFNTGSTLQWNLSWETTAMRDHLSWRATSFWEKVDIHFSVNEPVTKDQLSNEKPHFYGHLSGLSRQVPLYYIVFFPRFQCVVLARKGLGTSRPNMTPQSLMICLNQSYHERLAKVVRNPLQDAWKERRVQALSAGQMRRYQDMYM